MDTVSKLSRAAEIHKSSIRFIGVPKTIDNDLILTDHTPGFRKRCQICGRLRL